MWFEEVKKNPFVVLGVHIFSGVAPCAVFVPPARNEKKRKEKGKKKNLNAITHLKVKTNSQKTPRIISQIRYKSSGGENSELQGFFIGGWLPEFVFSRFRLHALSTWRGLGKQFGRPIIM